MWVLGPARMEPPAGAKGKCDFIDHSPDDRQCHPRCVELAERRLKENDAIVERVSYKGGHGWRGDSFGRLKKGFKWLEDQVQKKEKEEKEGRERRGKEKGNEEGGAESWGKKGEPEERDMDEIGGCEERTCPTNERVQSKDGETSTVTWKIDTCVPEGWQE